MPSQGNRTSFEGAHLPWTATAATKTGGHATGPRKPPSRTRRKRTTSDVGVGCAGTPPVEAASFVQALCERHQGWVTNEGTRDRLPAGWHVMVEQVFADVATFVGSRRYVLRRLEAEGGELVVALDPAPNARVVPSAEDLHVTHLMECAKLASRRLCQVCGKLTQPRAEPGSQPLCTAHARDCDALVASVSTAATVSREGGGGLRTPCRESGGEARSTRVQLYRTSDVAAALDPHWDDPLEPGGPGAATEHGTHLRRILQRGEAASWRSLAVPSHEQHAALDDLGRRAPHFGEVTDLVRRHVDAAINMGASVTLPALVLVGEAGFGKSWYVSRLAAALGLPTRALSMNSASMGDSLTGAFPVWRNAREGLVARTLLAESAANPVFLVDEIDKPASYNGEDPYRPYYTLLEPENARALVDDYLGFAIDASHASWVLAGNTVQTLPGPILDRLTVVTIPPMDDEQRRTVAESVYADANASRRDFFDPLLPDGVADRLAPLTARGMRRALGDAMVRAAAAGRRVLVPDDVVGDHRPTRRPVGFGPWS